MNWQNYESIVKYIYEQIGKTSNIKILGHGATCKVQGKSGVKHQLDVLTQHSDGIHSYRTAIECKYWNNKVQKDTVTKLAEILEDAQIEKGVIVSKTGFTADATSFAKYKNISLVELRKPIDDDWEGRIKDIHINIRAHSPHIYDLKIIHPESHAGETASLNALSTDIFFNFPDKTKLSAQEVIEGELNLRSWQEHEITLCEAPFPEGSTITIVGETFSLPVSAIKFSIRRSIYETSVEIRGEDYVSMVMNCIFEDKVFFISKDGQIRESEP